MSDFTFMTTFAKHHEFGYQLAKTFSEFVPGSRLIIYGDQSMKGDFDQYPNVELMDLDMGPIREFIEISKRPTSKVPPSRRSSYLFDSVRFCFKSFAMIQHAPSNPTRYMVWVDSDVEFNRAVSDSDLKALVYNGCYSSYLARPRMHTETGWLVFDTQHKYHSEFFASFRDMYTGGRIFKLKAGWTDCHAFDWCVGDSLKKGVKHFILSSPKKLRKNSTNVWSVSKLHEFSRHWKGPREGFNKECKVNGKG